MKIVIDLPEEVTEWFKERAFIPIKYYTEVEKAMEKAETLSENKGDLISRKFLQTAIHNYFNGLNHAPTEEDIQRYIEVAPSVESKGEWISHYDEEAKEGWYECSCCHSERAFNTNFCPDCGADMREPKDILHEAIDNTIFAEEAYPNIKEELHKAVDMAEPKGEKGD